MLAEVSPILPRTVLPLIQPQHVAGHVMQPRTIGQLLLDVGRMASIAAERFMLTALRAPNSRVSTSLSSHGF